MTASTHAGGCLCGAVRFTVTGPLSPVVNCHCGQCRRFHGSAFGAYTDAPRQALAFDRDDGLAWYDSSPGVRRGFCRICGASLFWEKLSKDRVDIAAGTLDQPTGLATVGHIFVRDRADFHRIADDLWQKPGAPG